MRLLKEKAGRTVMFILTVLPTLLLVLMFFGLFRKSRAILALKSFGGLLFSSGWHPLRGEFGLFPFLIGTLWVTAVALVIAVPISLLMAVYLSEYAPRGFRDFAKPLIDLLSGIPSVIFGVWGVLVIVPLVGRIAPLFGRYSSGYSVLAGGIVLAVMIFPTIIHVALEVFSAIPFPLREASLSLGATRWETTRHVVLRKGSQGIIAACVLGLSRALGETMAVLMVVGNVPAAPKSVFDAGYPLPALIANNYGEILSVPLYDSALMLAALVLFIVVQTFNILARWFLVRAERRAE
ncbi:MAG: phosphate ABC transporter permease subunit PstC [Candidatus Aminicenantes bacterium]|nr:phosphate ABC transporter permease subunit PstC [Candidatus Aminicenantes bacterium]